MPAPSLTDLVAPGRCALLLQEVQEGVVGRPNTLGLYEAARETGLIANLGWLTRAARAAGVPVLHLTAADAPGGFGANHNARLFGAARSGGTLDEEHGELVRPVESLVGPGDLVLPRYHGLSPLTGSQVDSMLRNEGITTAIITGVSLNVAIPNMVFDAVNRSYQAVVVTDAVIGVPVEYGRQVIQYSLRPLATLVTTAELVEAWAT